MMATKSAAMHSAHPAFHWSRKLLLLLLLTLAVALGLAILFRRNMNAPLFLFNAFADAALGVAAGVGSRLVFRRRHWLLRLAAAVLLCVLGLLVLGQLTAGISGIGPVRIHSVTINWLERLGFDMRPALPVGFGIRCLVAGFARLEWSFSRQPGPVRARRPRPPRRSTRCAGTSSLSIRRLHGCW
jgi:hypothetical protein